MTSAFMTESLVGLGLMLVLAFLRLPIALSMGRGRASSATPTCATGTGPVAFATAADQDLRGSLGRNYALTVVPLFILMGNFVTRAGHVAGAVPHQSLRLHRPPARRPGDGHHRRLTPASVRSAARRSPPRRPFAKVAYPSMKKFGYSDALATGSIAAGGTLGILINPPSTIMVIYGIMTGTSIGKLFAAGIKSRASSPPSCCGVLPVQYFVWRDPASAPRGERLSWKGAFSTRCRRFGWF